MTTNAALYSFFSSFGISAYPEDSNTEKEFPYLTYTAPISALDEGETSGTINLWYKTESESVPNAKAKEISDAIGRGGKLIQCDDGYIWVKRGSPFCQNLADSSDDSIKRRYILITIEYFM